MTIIKGLLKDKLGNQLYPETSFDQVKDDDGKTLKVWRGEIDGKVTTYDGLLGPDGNIKLEKLPEVLSKFKGSFANAEALPKEGTAGDYAICNDTDTIWVWDAEKAGAPGWIDTGKKGNVTSVNGKTGDLTIELADLGVTISAADINGLPAKVDTKVATADIVDNVTSTDTSKPLSANQGKVLDGKITALSGGSMARSLPLPSSMTWPPAAPPCPCPLNRARCSTARCPPPPPRLPKSTSPWWRTVPRLPPPCVKAACTSKRLPRS